MKSALLKSICLLVIIVLLIGGIMECTSSQKADARIDRQAMVTATEKNKNAKVVYSNGTKVVEASIEAPWRLSAPKYIISDDVIVDNDNCTFKIIKAYDDGWEFTLKVFCENKTADKTLMFSVDKVSVNGYMIDPFWATEVLPGKKANSEISFYSTDFKEAGINAADEISFTLKVYDSDNWTEDYFVNEQYVVYPTGLSSEEIVCPERATTPVEQVVFDNDVITFVILKASDDDSLEYTLQCYLENKTDKTLMFSWDDVSVNGYMVDPFWAIEISPGKRCYSGIDFSKSDFDDNDITEVEEISYRMRVYDSNNWSAKDLVNEYLSFKPE